ncbi:DNA polymerase I, thermostable [bioreactor metagenome]|uniref:DNA-directed DNA polymerase n=1 Tax=bioreactor metagenome TaxID=1076179 RepID=A0A644UA52_9ZZZZ|nr:DNA polymerase [Candidatus Elulimicrobiales bacterium]
MKKRLVLLDSHALLHRAYHALPGFSTYDGRPTGALFGFVKMILKIKDELKPDYLVACFDRKEATFRHETYENYKAHRAKSDDELVSQLIEAPRICEALNIPVYSLAGFEADDLLGTIVENLKEKNFQMNGDTFEIFIASGDLDTMQLLDKEENVKVYTLKKGLGETIVYKYPDVVKRYSFTPEQISDFKGLRGDPSDNIIGIKGIGEKTATTLINLFGSIENMYDLIHTDIEKFKSICKEKKENKITDRIINLIIEGEEEALFSKTLATIKKDVPINFTIPEKVWLESINEEEFNNICKEFEFRSFKNAFSKSGNKVKNLPLDEIKIGGLDAESFKETIEAEEDLAELKVLTNLWNSEITNPSLETILESTSTDGAAEAKEYLEEELKKENLWDLYTLMEEPIISILKTMKKNGILLDKNILKEQSIILHSKLEKIEKEIFKEAEEEFNISSPKQLGYILYEKLKIGEKIKKTAGGALTTNAAQLEKLKENNKIVANVLEHRELSKLLSTYVDTLPAYVEEDGRIRSTFVQSGTSTGRFSSENPNLQNLPVKSEEGLNVRKAFITEKGFKFLSVDYSQIDLRSVAILSKDPNLLEIFKKGTDVHAGVAAKVFSIDESEVTSEMRRKAKTINFGILYGMGVTALKDSMQVDRKEAQDFYDEYKKTFNVMIDYLEKVKLDAKKNGYTETLFKRRRQIPLMNSKLPFLKAQGERIAINAPVQGTTADILKLAMIDVDEYIKNQALEKDVKILLQIHDELVLEVKAQIIDKVSEDLKNIMEEVLEKRLEDKNWQNIMLQDTNASLIPLKVDVEIGDSLYEVK